MNTIRQIAQKRHESHYYQLALNTSARRLTANQTEENIFQMQAAWRRLTVLDVNGYKRWFRALGDFLRLRGMWEYHVELAEKTLLAADLPPKN